jgi:hypothetical protein
MNQTLQQANQEPQRARIKKAVEEEFPGHVVIFDDDSKMMIRFRIEDQDGTKRSTAAPHLHPSEIEDKSDAELRILVRSLCGISN